MKKDNIRVARIHICAFEKTNENQIKVNIQKYPDRLCVIDDKNNIAIDIETKHQYPYIKTINMLYFNNKEEERTIRQGKRVACFDYSTFLMLDLTSTELNCCNEIIEQLNQGVIFIDGNEVLTNEEYLDMIKNTKKENSRKKMYKKGI